MSRTPLLILSLILAMPAAEAGILKDGAVPTDVSRPGPPVTRGFRPPPPPSEPPPDPPPRT